MHIRKPILKKIVLKARTNLRDSIYMHIARMHERISMDIAHTENNYSSPRLQKRVAQCNHSVALREL